MCVLGAEMADGGCDGLVTYTHHPTVSGLYAACHFLCI